MQFDCTTERRGDIVLVTPFGEIDRDTAPQLRAALTAAAGVAGGESIRVDLRHVTFLDSSGLGALLAGYRAATAAGATLRVHDPTPAVRTVLDVANVWDLLGS